MYTSDAILCYGLSMPIHTAYTSSSFGERHAHILCRRYMMLHEYHYVLFVAEAGERVVRSVNYYTGMAKAVGKYKAVEVIILYIVLGSLLFFNHQYAVPVV